jgi:lysyl-tRNA synthetase class 2
VDLNLLKSRARFLQVTRRFFIERGYLEVETPVLAPFLIPEPSLEVFKTDYIDSEGRSTSFYLIPSPELWMKRLLAEGAGSLFQITKSFRNLESIEKIHNPEFTLLEWYTVGHGYMDSISVIEDMISCLCDEIPVKGDLAPPYRRIAIRQAFLQTVNLDLERLVEHEELYRAAETLRLSVSREDSWEQLFNKIFLTHVEPDLPKDRPFILYDYPKAIPTLAKSRGPFAERWELFIRGVEIANCFTEETSQNVLNNLFAHEAERKRRCAVPHRIDYDLLRFFGKGYPECSGVALGMDRLFMVLSGQNSIDRVISFPFSELFSFIRD